MLDSDTHKEWELQTSALPDIPATPDVIKFLEDRCKALELLQANQPTGAGTHQRPTPTGNKVSQSHKCHMTTQGQCPLCKGKHRLYQCSKFIDKLPTQRLECVKQLRACFNCFQPYSTFVQVAHVRPATKDIILCCTQLCKADQLIARDQRTVTTLVSKQSKMLLLLRTIFQMKHRHIVHSKTK